MILGGPVVAAPCLRVAIVNWIGLLHLRGTSDNFTISGPILPLLVIIAEKMERCFEIVVPPSKTYGTRLENGSWLGMMAQLASREVDMSGVPVQIDEARSTIVDQSISLLSELVVLIYIKPKERSDLAGFIKPFAFQVLC
ncbi:glutamate receptor ionotropic, delta-1-like [Scylla paramamosain]|uniref:glutamate receptor ionotropic, delta-1-like n=1 Tax=Scylla paramamosain TaxID=85552 RepID=UPI0030837B64